MMIPSSAPRPTRRSRRRPITQKTWPATARSIFLLRSRRPNIYNRSTRVDLGGDPNAPPIGIEVDERVHFYMPTSGRDQPEVIPDEQPVGPITIEGSAEEDAA